MNNDTTTSWNDTQKLLAFVVVVSFIAFLFIWTLFPPKGVDQSILTVVNVLLGALVAKFSSVVDYYFGSSRGERNKDGTLASLAAPGAPQTPTATPAATTPQAG
jgi:hypothetical protein